ncbi:MAG: hypothetical protein HYY18_17420 [Planctomycetes bacterium]|nr:hypothetical protein [Planctomycetota bacterium]
MPIDLILSTIQRAFASGSLTNSGSVPTSAQMNTALTQTPRMDGKQSWDQVRPGSPKAAESPSQPRAWPSPTSIRSYSAGHPNGIPSYELVSQISFLTAEDTGVTAMGTDITRHCLTPSYMEVWTGFSPGLLFDWRDIQPGDVKDEWMPPKVMIDWEKLVSESGNPAWMKWCIFSYYMQYLECVRDARMRGLAEQPGFLADCHKKLMDGIERCKNFFPKAGQGGAGASAPPGGGETGVAKNPCDDLEIDFQDVVVKSDGRGGTQAWFQPYILNMQGQPIPWGLPCKLEGEALRKYNGWRSKKGLPMVFEPIFDTSDFPTGK